MDCLDIYIVLKFWQLIDIIINFQFYFLSRHFFMQVSVCTDKQCFSPENALSDFAPWMHKGPLYEGCWWKKLLKVRGLLI